MKKKMLVLLVVLLLVVSPVQVAFAAPAPPNNPPTGGSCHMVVSWWEPGTGPGNAKGVEPGERGMYHVHMREDHPRGYTKGAHHRDLITTAHGWGPRASARWAASIGKSCRPVLLPAPGRANQFPRTVSRNMALSSESSATSFFSRVFSFSSSFSRRT